MVGNPATRAATAKLHERASTAGGKGGHSNLSYRGFSRTDGERCDTLPSGHVSRMNVREVVDAVKWRGQGPACTYKSICFLDSYRDGQEDGYCDEV
jgi:hypothetical protein